MLEELSRRAFGAFDEAQSRVQAVVSPAVPILFFGDVGAYFASRLRVITVGLNPSLAEFPTSDPFSRFRAASDLRAVDSENDRERYLKALAQYFRERPYRSWFATYEALLEGMDASFYDGYANTALHTDICSPVATDPTWSRLPRPARQVLISRGRTLWHDLVRFLRPHAMLVSVAREHLDTIDFTPEGGWEILRRIERTNPYVVQHRRFALGDASETVLVFGRAAQNPFGLIGKADKRTIGAAVRDLFRV